MMTDECRAICELLFDCPKGRELCALAASKGKGPGFLLSVAIAAAAPWEQDKVRVLQAERDEVEALIAGIMGMM